MAAASSSGAKPPVEYEGAAAHAAPVTEAKMYPCAICETPWPHLSMMCYLRSDDKKFHVSEDGDLSKTKAAVCGKFQQRGSAEQVVFACFMCAGTAHGSANCVHGSAVPTKQGWAVRFNTRVVGVIPLRNQCNVRSAPGCAQIIKAVPRLPELHPLST